MPNRILKESICKSEEIDLLSWFEEVLFYRLIVSCDDFGRYDGRVKIIKGTCFPLKDVTEKDIEKALAKLSSVGLLIVYKYEEKPYLQLVTWGRHQNVRAQRSKYPEFDDTCIRLYTEENKSKPKKAPKAKEEVEVEIEIEVNPPIITLLLNTGEEYHITQQDINEWMELYPAVDIMQELRKMKGWCNDNPKKRKTESGIKRFIGSWLSKEQDKGGSIGYSNRPAYTSGGSKVEQFAASANEWANG